MTLNGAIPPQEANWPFEGTVAQQIKARVHRRLLETINLAEAQRLPYDQLQSECARRAALLLDEQSCPLSAPERRALLRDVLDEVFGLGPIEECLRDPLVSDVLVNGAKRIYVERDGRIERVTTEFRDDNHLLQVIQRIAARVGRRIDESSPMLDARLLDGSRVNAIIPPLVLNGPTMSLRRFGTIPIDALTLVQLGTLTPEMSLFLEGCVKAKANILVSGGTGAGKTTLLNVLAGWIPDEQRVITIEDAAELRFPGEHVVRLETRPPNIEGRGEITQRELLRNSLRMRPDRIIIGEVRGSEVLDMLQAMNTGHEGSMTTVHANNPRDGLRRIENMFSMTGMNYPVHAIREQIASALHLLIHIGRVTGGHRKVLNISEVTSTEGETICLQDLFRFVQEGIGPDGHSLGAFEACGIRPRLLDRLLAEGLKLPDDLFLQRRLRTTGRK
jgi:pilus assembly protein CpaF